MLLSLLRLVRRFFQTFLEEDAPRRVAFGFALGMMIGLVPKGNLVAIALSTFLLCTRSSLIAAAFGTALFSWIGMLTDPLAHRLGLGLLTCHAWQGWWTRLYELPLAPWTKLNNTVVLGNLLLGLVLLYPVYRLSRIGFERYREHVLEKAKKLDALKVLSRAETMATWRVS